MKAEYIEKPFAPFKIVVETPEDLKLLKEVMMKASFSEARYSYGAEETTFSRGLRMLTNLIKNPT